MFSFLRIFLVVVLALALIDWFADRRARSNIPNATPGWALLSSDVKTASSANANENEGTVPPGEAFLPGDIKYESPNGNVRIYFPIATSILLSLVFTLVLRAWRQTLKHTFKNSERICEGLCTPARERILEAPLMSAIGGKADIART
jgi:DUF2905 family protein